MISKRKKYIIQLFLKRCTLQSINKAHIDFSFSLLKNTFKVPEEKLKELENKYNIDEYIERLTPLIDEYFTIEELQIAIKFFSNNVGRKMIDLDLLEKVGKVGTTMFNEIEQEFATNSEK